MEGYIGLGGICLGPARGDGAGPGPKTWLMGRRGDRPAGCGFVAVAGDTASLMRSKIAPEARRQGARGRA